MNFQHACGKYCLPRSFIYMPTNDAKLFYSFYAFRNCDTWNHKQFEILCVLGLAVLARGRHDLAGSLTWVEVTRGESLIGSESPVTNGLRH